MATTAAPKNNSQAPVAGRAYYIVNPAGAIHSVTREHAAGRLRQVGFRMATKDEIAALEHAGGHQVAGKPLAAPHTADPDAAIDLGDRG